MSNTRILETIRNTLLYFLSLFLFPVLWPISILISLGLIGLSLRKKRKKLALLFFATAPILLFPFLSLYGGIQGYFRGTAEIHGHGMYMGERFNLDPVYRCFRRSSGCCVIGIEDLLEKPNNLAIHYLTQWFGPMSGSYLGPYPSKKEAYLAIKENAETITYETFLKGTFSVLNVPVQLDPNLAKEAIYRLHCYKSTDQLNVALIDGQCLVVRKLGDEWSDWPPTALIDVNTTTNFANYLKFPDPEELDDEFLRQVMFDYEMENKRKF